MSSSAYDADVCGGSMGVNSESLLPGLFIHTFGCQLNEYDSEKIFMLLAEDYRPVDSVKEASVVFINSCSVRHKAEHKLYGLLGKLELEKQKRPELIIGVGGCVAQQEGERILKRFRKVNFVVGTHNISRIPELVKNASEAGTTNGRVNQALLVDMRKEWERLPLSGKQKNIEHSAAFGVFYSPTRAFVAIQRGCNNHCSYCVVPHTRGAEISRDYDEIIDEITIKTSEHPKEIMLLGTTVNSYGRDLLPKRSFSELVRRVADIPNVIQIRFMSPHPRIIGESSMSGDFVELYGEVPKMAPHIHLPLQSGSNRILKLMNRGYTREQYFDIVDALIAKCPDIAITTDLIVGFPTETEADFEDTLDVMQKVCFSASYSFCYSERPNTSAFGRYCKGDMIDAKVASRRLSSLQKLQNALSLGFHKRYVGATVCALVEGVHKHELLQYASWHLMGRTPHNVLVEVELDKEFCGSIVERPVIDGISIMSATPHCIKGVLR